MKSFTIALLAASTSAVRMNSIFGNANFGADDDDLIYANLATKIEEQVKKGMIQVVDADNIDSMEQARLKLGSIFPVMTPAEQIQSVVAQVKEGFGKIATINKEAEKEQIDMVQDIQDEEIEEVMEEANDEAKDIIEEEDDVSEAADEVEDVMEDAAEEIIQINKEHDKEVATISKTSFVAEITNDTVKDKILREIVDAASAGEDINEVISKQHLPFNVQTPMLLNDKEDPQEKLDRIVCRSGDCMEEIKKDPEFDAFLGSVVEDFDALKKQKPTRPEPMRGPAARPTRPEAPERPDRADGRQRPVGPRRGRPLPPKRPDRRMHLSGPRGPRGPRGPLGQQGGSYEGPTAPRGPMGPLAPADKVAMPKQTAEEVDLVEVELDKSDHALY